MGNLDRQEPETGFWLRHRPQRVCAFAKASPTPKNPRFAALYYFFQCANDLHEINAFTLDRPCHARI